MPDNCQNEQAEKALSRKDFIKQGLQSLVVQMVETLPTLSASVKEQAFYLRPPGALPPELFNRSCHPFCSICRDACFRSAIQPDSFGFPSIRPEVSPCVMCTDVPCTKACPTGALANLDSPWQIKIGIAIIEPASCAAHQGSDCKTCYEICPLQDKAIQLIDGLPQLVTEHCTGCGICVYECPSPNAVVIQPLF